MRGLITLSAMIVIVWAPGAVAISAPSSLAPIPPSGDVDTYIKRQQADGEGDRVLDDMEIGARGFWAGRYPEATTALDDALQRIEAVYGNDPKALQARSLWYEEKTKSFKGEPYERVMAYYYRGLLYLRAGDYENARAAFRNGQLQDAFAEEEQYQCDFALMMFLEAWASHLNHDYDLRDEALARLRKYRPDYPGIGVKDDTLILAETGSAPRKLGDGAEHAFFVYRRGKGFTENRADLVMGANAMPMFPMEDIFFQAKTRGGREIDKILNGKVQFVDAANGTGSVLSTTSVVMGEVSSATRGMRGSSQIGAAGAVIGGVGALGYLIAANAKPTADTRTWTSLPDTVHVITVTSSQVAAGGGLAVRFLGPDGAVVVDDKPLMLEHDPHGAQLGWARSR